MGELEIISVHVPKCAGSSLKILLEQTFGFNAVYRDYNDRPSDPASPMNMDPDGFYAKFDAGAFDFLAGKKVVHGHFHPRKYRHASARVRITFLREPIDRLISHYFFWKAGEQHKTSHALRNYFLENNLSIEGFARLPLIRHLYSAVFFGDVDMESFDLVGFYDRTDQDLERLRPMLGLAGGLPTVNVNTFGGYNEQREAILADPKLMGTLRDLLRDDLDFYERVRVRWPG